MIIFLRKYKSKIALMVFVCVLVCTVSCLLDFKTLEKQKMPGLEKKSVFMAAENTVAKNTDKAVNEPRLHAMLFQQHYMMRMTRRLYMVKT